MHNLQSTFYIFTYLPCAWEFDTRSLSLTPRPETEKDTLQSLILNFGFKLRLCCISPFPFYSGNTGGRSRRGRGEAWINNYIYLLSLRVCVCVSLWNPKNDGALTFTRYKLYTLKEWKCRELCHLTVGILVVGCRMSVSFHLSYPPLTCTHEHMKTCTHSCIVNCELNKRIYLQLKTENRKPATVKTACDSM